MSIAQQYRYDATILRALLWRHNSATALTSLVKNSATFYDTNVDTYLQQWYNDVFNLETATLFGLVVWAIILRSPISIAENPTLDILYGFSDDDETFDNAPNYPLNTDDVLTPDDARLALRLRYRTLTTNASVFNVNKILEDVFDAEGVAYVIDNKDMTAGYVFNFSISASLKNVIEKYDLLPRPVGVGITLTINP